LQAHDAIVGAFGTPFERKTKYFAQTARNHLSPDKNGMHHPERTGISRPLLARSDSIRASMLARIRRRKTRRAAGDSQLLIVAI
jgi:hypothetical protein